MNRQVGVITKKVIDILGLDYKEGLPIILGDSNIEHMKRQHLEDYEKYGKKKRCHIKKGISLKKIYGNAFSRICNRSL